MRKISAFLLALATLNPAPIFAQTRVGTVSAGMTVTASPVPALSAPAMALSAGILPAASLTPALAEQQSHFGGTRSAVRSRDSTTAR